MIKVEELRTGNWITLNIEGGKPFKWTYKIMSTYNETDFMPILLTVEILQKAGVVDRKLRLFRETWLFLDKDEKGFNVFIEQAITIDFSSKEANITNILLYHRILYLHQLQNIYHSLTGKELTINLNQLQQA